MKILIGNLFDSNVKTLVNTVNCVGIMGKGIALEFKRRYPDMFKEYAVLCNAGVVRPGKPHYYQNLLGVSVLNFPTKDHWRSSSKLSYITNGLQWFVENYEALGITSIAFPPLGCGNGGLTWEIVGPIMYSYLKDLPIEVEIYAPFGTPKSQLTAKFMEDNLILHPTEVLGAKSLNYKEKWLLLLETIMQINSNKYTLGIGRTMMQKIAYILTLEGVDTGFVFKKSIYGPYCEEVNTASTAFSNANLMTEKQVGKMFKIEVTDHYLKMHKNFTEEDLRAVKKTVDLFARIKNTSQAELFATIIFSYHQLRDTLDVITEQAIYDYIIDWKPRWKKDKKQNNALIHNIRNLALLQWISPSYSQGLLMELDFE